MYVSTIRGQKKESESMELLVRILIGLIIKTR